jgi:hypothetical protein
MKNITVPTKEIRWLTDQAFVTRKREVKIRVAESITFYNTFWDEGSRNVYKAVSLKDGTAASLITGISPWSAVAEGKTVNLEPGVAIVEESIFCGKVMRLTVHLHPSNVTPALEAHMTSD